MNPKLILWALGVSMSANVAAVGFWLRERESTGQVGRYTVAYSGGGWTRCDTVTGRVEVAALPKDGKMAILEIMPARFAFEDLALPSKTP